MKGIWYGTYSYLSKRLPDELRNRETKFRMEITEFDGSKFSGTVEDDSATGGMKGVGKVEGRVKGETVEFVKEMPIQTMHLPDGTRIEENRPHRKIYYTGKIMGDEMEGIWRFKFGIGRVNNGWGLFPPSKGKWRISKSDSNINSKQ